MKGTLERRLLVLCFLALLVSVAVNTGFSVESFRQQYRDGVLRRCQTVASGLKTQIEKVLALGVPLVDGYRLARGWHPWLVIHSQVMDCRSVMYLALTARRSR